MALAMLSHVKFETTNVMVKFTDISMFGGIQRKTPSSMTTAIQPVYELQCSCNEYPWGKQGKQSLSAQLCAKQPGYKERGPKGEFSIDDSTSYAEMWMGTYPDLPSYVAATGEDLQDVLDRYPDDLLGKNVVSKFGHTKLPFLPKVLSIAKALPLQLHPNKDLSSKLHKEDPQNFTDPNHKPEIALALGDFEAFCGFKPLERIQKLLKLDVLKQFVPSGTSNFDRETLRETVRNMLKASPQTISDTVQALAKISSSTLGKEDDYIPKLAPRLAEQYDQSDNGVVVTLVTMNYLQLKAGDSIYIPADGIHAYLSGDIIECMARSNNVLNTGFCPSADRDNVDLFCSCLTFSPSGPEDAMLHPRTYDGAKNGRTKLYSPPLSEFDMLCTSLDAGESETLKAVDGPSILISSKGDADMRAKGPQGESAQKLKEGHVFFVAQGVELELHSEQGLLMHTAFVR